MKIKFLSILTSLLIIGTGLTAQVTIGSELEPNSGALLDVKETNGIGSNTNKGFMLPRVNLSELNQLYPMFSDDGSGNYLLDSETRVKADEDIAHTGLTVYNLSTDFCKEIYPGPYTWDGQQWNQIVEGMFPSETSTLVDTRDPSNPVTYPIGKFGDGGWWMLENLRADRWPDGTKDGLYFTPPKSEAILPSHSKMSLAAYWYPSADKSTFEAHPEYGYAYSGYAALRTTFEEIVQKKNTTGIQGICPTGWHIPTQEDWLDLGYAVYLNPCQYAHSTIHENVGYNMTSMTMKGEAKSRVTKQGGFNGITLGYTTAGYVENENPDYDLVTDEIEVFPIIFASQLGIFWLSDTTTKPTPSVTKLISGFTAIIQLKGLQIGNPNVSSSTISYSDQAYVRCKKD